MVRRKPLVGLVGVGLVLLLLVAAEAPQALRTASAGVFLIREGEVVEEDLYVAGDLVRIAGTIQGDLVVLATDHLEVSGRVEGDVIGLATTADIKGVVTGSVRLGAADMEVAAEVAGDVVGVGRDVRLGGTIAGDTLIWSRSLFAGGEIGHDMGGRTFGATTIAGGVGRDVEMTVGRMRVLEGARVAADLGYRSAREATIDPGADIGGTVVRRLPLNPDFRLRSVRLMFGFIAYVLLLASGLLRIRFRPEQVGRSVQYLARHPGKSLLHGLAPLLLLALLVAGLLSGVLWGSPRMAVMVAWIGLVVTPVIMTLLLFLVVIAPVSVMIIVGHRISGRMRVDAYMAFVLSAVPLGVLLLFPYVGIIAGIGVVTLGTGTLGRKKGWEYTDRLPRHRDVAAGR